jgi:hypothetical protein
MSASGGRAGEGGHEPPDAPPAIAWFSALGAPLSAAQQAAIAAVQDTGAAPRGCLAGRYHGF